MERKFSLAKRNCDMGLITVRIRETATHVISMYVLALMLRRIQCAALRRLVYLMVNFLLQINGYLFNKYQLKM